MKRDYPRPPRPRTSIARVMVLVGILALNFAYLRHYGIEGTLLGTRLIVVVVQLGVLCRLRSHRNARRFWGGFVVFGVIGLLGWFFAAYRCPETTEPYFQAGMIFAFRRFLFSGSNQLAVDRQLYGLLGEPLVPTLQIVFAILGASFMLIFHRTNRK